MKYIATLIMFSFLLAPGMAYAQNLQDSINVDDLSNTIDSTQETLNILQTALEIGGQIFSIVKSIINTVDSWLQQAVGISLSELVKSLFNAIVKILEVVLDLIQNIIPN